MFMGEGGGNIVTGSYDRTVRLWTVKYDSEESKIFKGQTGYVQCVAMSADTSRIVSGSDDRMIQIWNTGRGKAARELLAGHTGAVWSMA